MLDLTLSQAYSQDSRYRVGPIGENAEREVLMKLVATWRQGQGPDTEGPTSVVWENGDRATFDDYRRHELDTHFWVENDRCEMERHMFPDIVADVAFDARVRDWVVTGQDVVPGALDLKDPNAPDSEIFAALFTFPTYYRPRINR